MAVGTLLGLEEVTGPAWTEVNLNDKVKVKHGIEAYTTLAFSDADKALSLATVTYWYKGVKYTTASPTTCDLDLTADRDNSSNTLTANTLYYFYFKNATGKLYWSDSAWSWTNDVFVATVFWNGSAGACQKETHSSTRDLNWHQWAHDTVGARLEGSNGFGITTPSVGTPGAIDLATGTLHDEDLDVVTGRQQVIRGWHLASATKYTFVDYATPYVGTAGQPQYLNVSGPYSLANVSATKYACYWVYASLDITRPIYVFAPTVEYNTVALARAETAPALTGFGLNTEMKIIYRWIFKGDGAFQETADYRASSPLPGGGSTTISAGNVTYSAGGGISATSVQSAIEELDSEKAATSAIPVVASSAEVNAGSDNAKFISASAIGGSLYRRVYIQASEPSSPVAGDLWINTT